MVEEKLIIEVRQGKSGRSNKYVKVSKEGLLQVKFNKFSALAKKELKDFLKFFSSFSLDLFKGLFSLLKVLLYALVCLGVLLQMLGHHNRQKELMNKKPDTVPKKNMLDEGLF